MINQSLAIGGKGGDRTQDFAAAGEEGVTSPRDGAAEVDA